MLKIHFHPDNTKTIIFFPFSGGFAFRYRPWAKYIPQSYNLFAVEYPGRGLRNNEAFLDNFMKSLKDVHDQVISYLKHDFIFIGECLGAYLSYELAMLLQNYNIYPQLLVVISAKSPFTHNPSQFDTLSKMSDTELMNTLTHLVAFDDNFPTEKNFATYILHLMRCDFRIGASYLFSEHPIPLRCPILSLVGNQDPLCIEESAESLWKKLSHEFTFKRFEGNHFFSNKWIGEISQLITKIF